MQKERTNTRSFFISDNISVKDYSTIILPVLNDLVFVPPTFTI